MFAVAVHKAFHSVKKKKKIECRCSHNWQCTDVYKIKVYIGTSIVIYIALFDFCEIYDLLGDFYCILYQASNDSEMLSET